MALRFGKQFYPKQDEMLRHAADAVIYIKFGMYEFTSFPSLEEFWAWYHRAREACSAAKTAFPLFELLRTGNNMCFVADLEVYCPPETPESELQKIEYIIKNRFRASYDKHGDAANLVITQNSRMSEYKKRKEDADKVPMYKISLHFLGRSEIFNEMHGTCEMRALAELVNTDLVAGVQDLVANHDVLLPGGDVLDLKIYTRNRAMSLIGTAKSYGSSVFERAQESKHVPITDCIATQQMGGEVTYFKLPSELSESVGGKKKPKPRPKRNVPTQKKVGEDGAKPPELERAKTEALLQDYLKSEFGDTVTVTYRHQYHGRPSYEARGDRMLCPCCQESHERNGAYIDHVGGRFFKYRCLAPAVKKEIELDLRGFQNEPPASPENKYLPPFWHINSKVISISAGMGTGKTTQIIADKNHREPKRVLVVTCRRGMATNLQGRFEGFTSYRKAIDEDKQIIEYESLYRLGGEKYDMIILDELRSTLSSAVCRETNNGHMIENMEKLQDLAYLADRVVCADADLHIDGAVETFYEAVFKGEDIHRIDHTGGGQELHAKWATEEAFVCKIQDDLRAGKRIAVCCGSANELKALEKIACEIIPSDEVGIYYSNSPNQKELADVDTYWPKYRLIGFTSTITVSVDYQQPIDVVYVSPSRGGCGPREMNQMKSRFRVIISGIVVVKIPVGMDATLDPLDADMQALFSTEMNLIMNRRAYVAGVVSERQRELNLTIFKRGVGHRADFYPSLLTDLWAWSNVERFLASNCWIQYLIQIFEAKGYTWSTCIEYIEDEEENDQMRKDFNLKRGAVKKDHARLLEEADVDGMTYDDFNRLVGKQKAGAGSLQDVARIEKFRVQRYFRDTVTVADIHDFNRFKLPIFIRAFYKAFPPIVRKRIDSTLQLMGPSLDDYRPNYELSERILRFLEVVTGTEENTLDLIDTRERKALDLQGMSEEAMDLLKGTNSVIRTAQLVRGSEACDPIQEFKTYLRNIWGYNLVYRKRQKAKQKFSEYKLVSIVPERLLVNEIYGDWWMLSHCRRVDDFIGKGHDERKLIRESMPMLIQLPQEDAEVDEPQQVSPKRKRDDFESTRSGFDGGGSAA